MSPSTSTNAYPFKDILCEFISKVDSCTTQCTLIRQNRSGASSSKTLSQLKEQLKTYSEALADRYNKNHEKIGSRWETGDEVARYDIQKHIASLHTYVFIPLHNLSQKRTSAHRVSVEAGFTEIHDQVVDICGKVLRVVGYLAERLSRKSSSPSPRLSSSPLSSSSSSSSYDRYSTRDQYTPTPQYQSGAWDPMTGYFTAPPMTRPVFDPNEYYGVREQLLYGTPQPQYLPARDVYGGVVFVRPREHVHVRRSIR